MPNFIVFDRQNWYDSKAEWYNGSGKYRLDSTFAYKN